MIAKVFCEENEIHYLDGQIINIDGFNFSELELDKYLLWKNYLKKTVSDYEINDIFIILWMMEHLIMGRQLVMFQQFMEEVFIIVHLILLNILREYQKLSNIHDYNNIDVSD